MAKLTTAEKIALARKQDSGGSGDAAAAPAAEDAPAVAESSAPEPAAEESSAAEEAPAKPAATPKSTADILAAARAQKAGGGGGGAAPAKPAATPKSTADILAAARAQKGGGAAAAAPAAKGEKKAAAAKTDPKPAVSTEGKSVKEMIEAARKPQAAEEQKKKAGPKLPSKSLASVRKPIPAKKVAAEETSSRRGVLAALVIGPFALAWLLLGTATGAFTLALARFMMPNVLVEPPTRFKIGTPGDFPPEAVITKFKAERGIWVVNTSSYNGKQMIYALSSVCTHLGCTPNWLEGEQKYKCPCHGSGFYINGINFEGPAPRPLERVGLSLAADGQLEVDKSLKFQQEMGQWEDPASFVPV